MKSQSVSEIYGKLRNMSLTEATLTDKHMVHFELEFNFYFPITALLNF